MTPYEAVLRYFLYQQRISVDDHFITRAALEKAVETDPGYGGNWGRSVEITTRAMELNPHHAGWYYFNTFFNEYRRHRYAEALAIAQKINLPDYWATPLALAVCYAELGREREAKAAAKEILRIWPEFERDYYQQGLVNWMFGQPELIDQIQDGLRKAGINMAVNDAAD
jgi:tetratricopeptide (TPR) repeat protein